MLADVGRTGFRYLPVATGVEATGSAEDHLTEDEDALAGGQSVDGHDEQHVHRGQDLALEAGG